MRRAVTGLVLGALLAGCGFQLRGQAPLPAVATRPFVESSDRFTPLHAALERRLRAAGAAPAANAQEASIVIRLHLDETGRELLSVTADNKPGEYEVYYAADFSVTDGTAELIARTPVKLTRNYGYDESAVLAKEHEEASLRDALAGEIADLVLRRLAAL
jgi:LPS-assembly lipoprotein